MTTTPNTEHEVIRTEEEDRGLTKCVALVLQTGSGSERERGRKKEIVITRK